MLALLRASKARSYIGFKREYPALCIKDETIPYNTWRFIQLSVDTHSNKYTYDSVVYKTCKDKVEITCKIHGNFWQLPNNHYNGSGCPKCAGNNKYTTDSFIQKSKEINGNKFLYKNTKYTQNHLAVTITCRDHGDFKQSVQQHLKGGKCPSCQKIDTIDKYKDTWESFVEKAVSIHGNTYTYKESHDYVNAHTKVPITCKKHGEFLQRPNGHTSGQGCPSCPNANKVSAAEIEIKEYIESYGLTTEKYILQNKKHIDIYIKELGIGIEYNGMYWHSEEHKPKAYHIDKTIAAEKEGIELIHVWEYEYSTSKNIVLSMIKSKLNLPDKRIYARKCDITHITSKEAREFCNKYHIQGYTPCSIRIALRYEGDIVMLATFGTSRFSHFNGLELIRLVSSCSVVGGASKLIAQVKGNIMSYARRDYSKGNVYEILGFKKVTLTEPNYAYFKTNNRVSRYQAMKHKLPILLGKNIDMTKTEKQLMKEAGYLRVYDCGNLLYIKETT